MRYAAAAVIMLGVLAVNGEEARNVRIRSDRCPDFYSTRTMAESVTKGLKTDRDKVLAIYDLFRSVCYHHAYPQEKDAHVGTLKLMNSYGWTLCGGQASCLITLFEDAGYKTRYRGWSNPGHTTMEVFYGGRWHYMDSFLKFVAFRDDGSIASQEDIIANPDIALRMEVDGNRDVCWYPEQKPDLNRPTTEWRTIRPMLVCRDTKEGVVQGCRNSKVTGWGGTGTRDRDGYVTDINIRPGMYLKLRWEADANGWFTATNREPGHSCGTRDFRNGTIIGPKLEPYGRRSWANGDLVFQPDMKKPLHLRSFDRASG
ncbi:MAG: hypothetical protein JW909_01460, partial [Planctomycetes bacterium]|nr:hypothetical protein [Planctomycetota bacterium]